MKKGKIVNFMIASIFSLCLTGCDAFDFGNNNFNNLNDTKTEEENPEEESNECKHIWTDWFKTKSASCISEGELVRNCTICGEVETSLIEIQPNNHEFLDTEIIPRECLVDGYINQVCTLCGYCENIFLYPAKHSSELVFSGDKIHSFVCESCGKFLGYSASIIDATGWNDVQQKMNGANTSTWKVDGDVDPGYYSVKMCAKLTNEEYGNRKWYNMSLPELQVDGDEAYNNSSTSPDTISQGKYRYTFKVDDIEYFPNSKKSFTTLGLSSESPNYIDFIDRVYIGPNTQSISLSHGYLGYSMIIQGLKLIPLNDNEHSYDQVEWVNGLNDVTQHSELICACGARKIHFNGIEGKLVGDSKFYTLNGNLSPYMKLFSKGDSIVYGFDSESSYSADFVITGALSDYYVDSDAFINSNLQFAINGNRVFFPEYNNKAYADYISNLNPVENGSSNKERFVLGRIEVTKGHNELQITKSGFNDICIFDINIVEIR